MGRRRRGIRLGSELWHWRLPLITVIVAVAIFVPRLQGAALALVAVVLTTLGLDLLKQAEATRRDATRSARRTDDFRGRRYWSLTLTRHDPRMTPAETRAVGLFALGAAALLLLVAVARLIVWLIAGADSISAGW